MLYNELGKIPAVSVDGLVLVDAYSRKMVIYTWLHFWVFPSVFWFCSCAPYPFLEIKMANCKRWLNSWSLKMVVAWWFSCLFFLFCKKNLHYLCSFLRQRSLAVENLEPPNRKLMRAQILLWSFLHACLPTHIVAVTSVCIIVLLEVLMIS